MTRDGIAGLVCLIGALVLLVASRGLPQPALVPIGPAFYPRILFGITAALSLLLLVSGLRQRDTTPDRAVSHRFVVTTFAIFIAYLVALPLVGYRVGTFLFVALLQGALERPVTPMRWLVLVGVALVTAVLTYYVFEVYLSVLLPRGRVTGL